MPAIPANLMHLLAQPTSQEREKLREEVEEPSSNSCEKLNPEGRVVCPSTEKWVFTLFQNNCLLLFAREQI